MEISFRGARAASLGGAVPYANYALKCEISHFPALKCGKVRESAGKCGKVRRSAGKCGEVRRTHRRESAGQCGEVRQPTEKCSMPYLSGGLSKGTAAPC